MCAFYTFIVPGFLLGADKIGDHDWSLLKAGEVVVEEAGLDESGGSVRIRILVRAPAERIWYIISRCQYAYRYLAGLKDCEIFLDEPHRALTRHVIDTGVFAPRLDYKFETRRQPFQVMDIVLVEGNLRAMDGYWKFHEVEEGVVLEHKVRVQPKVPAPRWLVRRKLQKDLPAMMYCIRGLAAGSLEPRSEITDMAACQVPDFVQDQ